MSAVFDPFNGGYDQNPVMHCRIKQKSSQTGVFLEIGGRFVVFKDFLYNFAKLRILVLWIVHSILLYCNYHSYGVKTKEIANVIFRFMYILLHFFLARKKFKLLNGYVRKKLHLIKKKVSLTLNCRHTHLPRF